MTDEELEAIAGGYHGDAFAVLGPHAARDGAKALASDAEVDWEVRAFLPLAQELEVLIGETTVPMTRVHPAGVLAPGFPRSHPITNCD